MSVRATSLVWERTRAKGSNLLMLLAIADYAKDDGRWAWPSARTLTWKTRLSGRGGELVLMKLVEDGEVMPEWNDVEHRLYLHIRAVMDWKRYQAEGPVPDSEMISRKQSANFSLRLVAAAERKAKSAAANAKTDAAQSENGGNGSISLDPSSDPSGTTKQGAAPQDPSQTTDETPDQNVGVITRLAHEVLDLFEETPDLTYTDIVESVKARCAVLHIAYRSDVVISAIEAAIYQRRRIGKSPVIAGAAGDAAFRLREARH